MSGLGATIISFSPNTIIRSADVNTNFSNLNNASSFVGGGTFSGTLSADGGLITSNGSGSLSIPAAAFYMIGAFDVMWSPSTQDLYINCPNVGGGRKMYFQVGGVNKMSIDTSGNVRAAGTVTPSVTP